MLPIPVLMAPTVLFWLLNQNKYRRIHYRSLLLVKNPLRITWLFILTLRTVLLISALDPARRRSIPLTFIIHRARLLSTGRKVRIHLPRISAIISWGSILSK